MNNTATQTWGETKSSSSNFISAPRITEESAKHVSTIKTSVVSPDGKTALFSPEKHEHDFLDLTKQLIVLTGMPAVGVRDIAYKRTNAPQNGWRTLASMQISGPEKGRFTVTDSVKHPEILLGLGGTVIHEMGHNLNPFDETNLEDSRKYKSPELGMRAAEAVAQLAEQTRLTHTYLNAYHKRIFEDAANLREQGKNTEAMALEILETHAIVMEMAVSAPKDLALKSQAMNAKMAQLGMSPMVDAEGVGLQCFSALVGFGNNRAEVTAQLEQVNARMKQAIYNHQESAMVGYNPYSIIGRQERIQ